MSCVVYRMTCVCEMVTCGKGSLALAVKRLCLNGVLLKGGDDDGDDDDIIVG